MLPTSLETATERMMRPDSIAREVFGNDFVDHFGGTREHEVALWNAAVTNWEGKFVSHLHGMRCLKWFLDPVERYIELA
jgi:glutamine synthetase